MNVIISVEKLPDEINPLNQNTSATAFGTRCAAKVAKLALKQTELSPRDLAVTFKDRTNVINQL